MKAGDIKRALADVPDDTEVLVHADSIRMASAEAVRLVPALAVAYLLKQFAEHDLRDFRERFACGDTLLRELTEQAREAKEAKP